MQSDIFTQDSETAYAKIAPNDVWEAEALAWIETIIRDGELRAAGKDQGKSKEIASSGTAAPAPSTTDKREPSAGK